MLDMTQNVQALILSGGYGKRLRPLTDSTPKGLMEIKDGFTILDKQLLDLKAARIENVFFLTGYLGEKIKQRYQDNWQGIHIHYFKEDEPMGTLWAVKNALGQIDSDVVVRNGDIVSEINLGNFIQHSKDSEHLLTIFITKMRSPYGILEVKDNKVLSFLEKPVLDHFINAGVYFIKKEAFPYFFRDYPASEKGVETTVFKTMSEQGLVGSYYEDVFWESVDGFKDLQRVREHYAK